MDNRLIAALFLLAITGCATTPPPMVLSDAVTAQSRFGAPETSHFGVPITGRNWSCRTCYN